MVTQWGRYKLADIEAPGCHVSGIQHLECTFKVNYPIRQKKAYQALYDWILHCRQDEQERFYHQMTVDHIHRHYSTSHKLLMIPCFELEASGSVPGWSDPNMMSISQRDMAIPGWNDDILLDDPRPCHMNRANNERFAHNILGWVHGSPFSINPDDYAVGHAWEIQKT